MNQIEDLMENSIDLHPILLIDYAQLDNKNHSNFVQELDDYSNQQQIDKLHLDNPKQLFNSKELFHQKAISRGFWSVIGVDPALSSARNS
ncbi:unnamed protein product [Adineta ricciae]|uniref:Uncharacterized protein n=1 Tax=Adineta ricciae TaxID=249248 RepID=A0A815SSP5_ADIRI|nr:unnamed protein product [Adineta ricciae]CAF1650166.1 unnamed protein product [Adineta ricciae]